MIKDHDKVYFLTDGTNIKIGFTKGKIKKRIQQLSTGSSRKIMELGWILGDVLKEKELHSKFYKDRIRYSGEWFRPSEELINYINEVNEKPNTGVDFVDGILMPLLKISC